MKRMRLLAGGILCLGVLLGGIGAGITVGEFSGFAYKKIVADADAFQTENYTCTLEAAEEPFYILSYGGGARSIEPDETMPENTMEVSVVYNGQVCRPDIWSEEGSVVIDLYDTNTTSDLERLMEWKDQVLEGLKEREFRDYQVEWIQSVTCRGNPADLDKVTFY